MATTYILYSKKIDSYYTGSCLDLKSRLQEHINNKYEKSFTKKADDWIVFLKINNLEYSQARNIEKHIKKMKSKIYITNLIKYPEIIEKLTLKYKNITP